MKNIKQKILDTNLFNDNEFLDKYCILIREEKNKKIKRDFNTNIHHIIPRCYFKIMKINPDETQENKVVLSIKNHILAHYYLCKCCKNNTKLYFSLLCALSMLVNKKESKKQILNIFSKIDLDEIERLVCEKNKKLSLKQKGNKFGLGVKLSEETKLKMKISRTGMLLSMETKNKIAKKTLNTHWINKNGQYKRVKQEEIKKFLEDGWILGGKPITDKQKQQISSKNTGKKRSEQTKHKMSIKAKGRTAWNKGIKCSEEVKNKIIQSKVKKQKHWYTNGEINVYAETCPDGFAKGRTISEETRKKCGQKNIGRIPWNKGITIKEVQSND